MGGLLPGNDRSIQRQMLEFQPHLGGSADFPLLKTGQEVLAEMLTSRDRSFSACSSLMLKVMILSLVGALPSFASTRLAERRHLRFCLLLAPLYSDYASECFY